MEQLNLPAYDILIKKEDGQQWVYDKYRKKYLVLTPEEWVRQHFLNYLINHLNYPKSLIRIESGVKVNKMGKRTDILVFDRKAAPYMLVECKASGIPLTQSVFEQLSAYNRAYHAPYLVITNGLQHYCCAVNYQSSDYRFLKQLPAFV